MTLSLARLATIRTSERTLSSGVLSHPTDSLYGKILYIIDIPLPLVVSEAVERTILETIKQEYFEASRKNAVYQFEDCLKQVNLALAELAESGQSDWVGHIHAILALWSENELFITHTGRILGLVARGESIVSLVEPSQYDRRILIHKTFANLTSGQLVENDVLILGNGEMSRHFSPQFLSTAAEMTPFKAVQSMFNTAQRLNLKFITAIVARVENNDEDEIDTAETPTVLLENNRISGAVTRNVPRAVSKAGVQVRSAIGSVPWGTFLERAKESAKRGVATIRPHLQSGVRNLKSAEKVAVEYDEDSNAPQNLPSETESSALSILQPQLIRSSGQKIGHRGQKYLRQTTSFIAQFSQKYSGKFSRKMLLATSVLLIVVVAGTSYRHAHPSKTSIASLTGADKTKVDATLALLKDATALAEKQPDDARAKLQTVNDNLNSLANVRGINETVGSMRSDSQTLLAKLNNITYIETNAGEPLANNTAQIAVIGQYLFTTQTKSGTLFRQTLGKKETPSSIYSVPKGTIVSLSVVEETRQIILTTDDKHIYRVSIENTPSGIEIAAPDADGWPAIQSLAWYQSNLYILEQGTGKIWKYSARDSSHYAGKQLYLATASLEDATARAITSDGYMYVLYADGHITKLLKGAPQSFGPLSIPKPDSVITNSGALFASAAATTLFIQDKNRLIESTKDGQFVRQYVLRSGTIRQSFVSPINKRAWVVVDSTLIETSL